MLDLVALAEKNNLRLPREFGLLIKQQLYFDRYTRILAPTLDPLRDSRIGLQRKASGEEQVKYLYIIELWYLWNKNSKIVENKKFFLYLSLRNLDSNRCAVSKLRM